MMKKSAIFMLVFLLSAMAGYAALEGAHDYFNMLAARPDKFASYTMRSQAELDSMPTGANPPGTNRQPITYQPAMDAALVQLYAPVTTDTQQKIVPLQFNNGSMLITWDFRFDSNFAYKAVGDMTVHKTWRFDPGWVALKTEYAKAANSGYFSELKFTTQAKSYIGPGTTVGKVGLGGETLGPVLNRFFIEPDTWTRVWLFVDDKPDAECCHLSLWAADEDRDPIQLYDEIAFFLPPPDYNGVKLAKFRVIEYDTSMERANNPEAHSWNRNLVILKNITDADVTSLLQKPVNSPVAYTPPNVTFSTDRTSADAPATIRLTAVPSDADGIAKVEFLKGNTVLSTDSSAPYEYTWSGVPVSSIPYLVTARAYDNVGWSTRSNSVKVYVGIPPGLDTQNPIVNFIVPEDGDTISNTIYPEVDAQDPDGFGIAGVQFKIDGVNKGSFDTSVPYSIRWDTIDYSNGLHTLTAIATDIAGKNGSQTITVTVDNSGNDTTAPIISNGLPTGTLPAGTTTATLRVVTNENANCKYSTTANVAYSSMANTFTTTGGTTHSSSISGLSNGNTYNYYVRCKDNSNNTNTNDYAITFSVGTTTLPIISLFNASPSTISAGQSSTLSWTTSGATSASINNGIGSVAASGTTMVSPATTTTYTLTASNSAGSVTRTAIVTVSSTALEGDINNDGIVDILDILVIANDFGKTTGFNPAADVAAPFGLIDIFDVLVVVRNWGNTAGGDTTPPILSNGLPTGTLAAGTTTATLQATTNENANCKYSTTANVAYSSMANTFSTTGTISHSSAISGLANGNTYSYYVRCKDASNNANMNDYLITFSVNSPDTTPPVISSVSASSASNSATITWTTNEPADSQVEYGLTTSYGSSTTLNPNLVTSHVQTIIGLNPVTLYHYRVKSRDASGNLAVSGDFTFTTTAPSNGSGNDYFNMLSAMPDVLYAYTMRNQTEINKYSKPTAQAGKFGGHLGPQPVYDPIMDAVKLVIETNDTTLDSQYRMPITHANDNETVLLTWDLYFGPEWGQSEIVSMKMIQIGSTDLHGFRWFEFRNKIPVNQSYVVQNRVKVYTDARPEYQPGPNVISSEPLQPYSSEILSADGQGFKITPNTWVRYWVLIERHPDPQYDLVTVWIADETRGPYKQYDQLQLKVPISLREFWLEFNSSDHRTGGPDLFAWARNFVMLRNPANILSLLQRPVK